MDQTILRRLRGKPIKRRFATLDIEARKWVEPYAAGFFDGRDYTDFVDYSFRYEAIDKALTHILTPRYAGWWIYAHNGGNYDFTFLFSHIIRSPVLRRKYHVNITPVGSTVLMFDVIEKPEGGVHKPGCNTSTCLGCNPQRASSQQLRWTFVDSARLMPLPLRDVCNTLGGTKKVELDISYDDLARPENRSEMVEYLKVDCVALHGAVGKMQETINGLGGQLCVSLPATALDLFRRSFQRDDIFTNRHYLRCPNYGKESTRERPLPLCDFDDKKVRSCLHAFIRRAFFGGRTEIIRAAFVTRQWIETTQAKLRAKYLAPQERQRLLDALASVDGCEVLDEPARMYDVNSHYPQCMLEPMPVGPAIEMGPMNEADVYENARTMVGIVDCDVYIPETTYLPPLPKRMKEKSGVLIPSDDPDAKIIFPAGYLSGTWDTAELLLLPRVGGKIVRSRRSVWFHAQPIFAGFIRKMFRYRDRNRADWEEAMDWIAKICMNASFGKWAMKEDRKKFVISPPSIEGLTPINFEADLWEQDTVVSPTYIVPQLSTHVTALARARLWEIMQGVIDKGGRVYYTDTDSVVCSGVELPTSKALGGLKLESTITRGEFVLPKLYLVETEEPKRKNKDGTSKKQREEHVTIKSKGLGPGIRTSEDGDDPLAGELSEAEWHDLVQRGVPIQRHRLSKLNESLREYVRSQTSFPRIIATSKQINSEYDKRTVLDDYDTVPKILKMF